MDLLGTHASAFTYVNVPSCPTVFCEAPAPVLAAGVCAPLHLVLFVHAHTQVHVWSQHWYAFAVSGLLLPTCAWIPRVCCGTVLRLSTVF